MVNTYVFRVILDTKEDIFRDIELEMSHTLEDLHRAILNAFNIATGEMASFYASDVNWTQGEEVPLIDMGPEITPITMANITLKNWVSERGKHMLYLYDYLNMWTFFCELMQEKETTAEDLPKTVFAFGEAPKEAPEKNFDAEPEEGGIFDDAFGEEDEDGEEFGQEEDYGDW